MKEVTEEPRAQSYADKVHNLKGSDGEAGQWRSMSEYNKYGVSFYRLRGSNSTPSIITATDGRWKYSYNHRRG